MAMIDGARMTREQRQELFDFTVGFLRRHLLEADDGALISWSASRGTSNIESLPEDGGFARVEYDGSVALRVFVTRPLGDPTAS